MGKLIESEPQMDYHMFLGHALAVNACHELVEGGKVGPAVSLPLVLYPLTNKPGGCLGRAKMNDWLKTNYCLEMHTLTVNILDIICAIYENVISYRKDGARGCLILKSAKD